MKTFFALGVASSVVVGCLAWSHSVVQRLPSSRVPAAARSTVRMAAWSGDRRPETNKARLDFNMDASFSRAGIRTVDYMDFDQQNPPAVTEWWKGYFPSVEEQEAAAQGYNFSDPEGWLKAKADGTLKVDLEEETELVLIESFTAMGREWPDMKKTIVAK